MTTLVSDSEAVVSRSNEHHAAWKHLPVKTCGHARSPNRIVGGTAAYLGQFPWIARIGSRSKKNVLRFFCGGALISKIFVLSASHCFYPKDKTYEFLHN